MCDHGVDAEETFFGTKSYMKLDGVGTTDNWDDDLSIVIMNISQYTSTWPQLAKAGSLNKNPWGVKPAGYLNNGRKTGTFDSGDILQLNLCANRMVKIKSCFVTAHPPSDPVTLSKASIRIFDLDHGKDEGANQDMGPEAIQFACPGGSFKLHGSEVEEDSPSSEFMVHMDDTTRALERPTDPTDISPNGLQVHTFDCPPAGKLVTMWSSRFGKGEDNPTDTQNLDQIQEQSMVIVNYANVDCFDITLANLPAVYEEGTAQAIADQGFAIQRLQNSEEIDEGDVTWKLDQGECAFDQSGRNWLLAGLKGPEGSDKCESPPPSPPSTPVAEEGIVCTNVDFDTATLDVSNMGGSQYCCVECADDTSKLCCPTRNNKGEEDTYKVKKDIYYDGNVCETDVPELFGTTSYVKLDGVQTNPNALATSLVIMNTTEYLSTWPKGKNMQGYLMNGRKSDTVVIDELFQLNLCANRVTKLKSCFVDTETSDKVTLRQASMRFFDIDHGKETDDGEGKNDHMGPEVIQFQCPGGSFQLYGLEVEDPDDGEFLVNMDTKSKTLEFPHDKSSVGISANGLEIHQYECPPAGEWVTLWSSRAGEGKENPMDIEHLNKLQEQSMVVVNYVNVDCFEVVVANLPSQYERGSFNENLDAIQLLKDSKEISETWPEMGKGECELGQRGRNWLFAGHGDIPETECSPPPMPPSTPPASPPAEPGALSPPPAPSPPPPLLTVHGDPMAKIGDKSGEHLWIASGVLTPLLEWTSATGKRMVLAGRTIDRRASGSQWFKQLVVSADGTRSLDMSAEMTDRGTVKVMLDGKAIRDTPVLGATSLYASTHQNVTLRMSKRPAKHVNGDVNIDDQMEIDADGLRITVWTSKAKKFTSGAEQNVYLHLNFKMEHGIPQGGRGLLAELAGDVPMSEATRAMFKQGRQGGRPLQPSAEPAAATALVAASALTVHGELAATRIGDKSGEHLWIASGVLTPMLEWVSATGKRMVLAGRTIDRRASGSQWFKQLVLSADGMRSLDMSADMTDRGTVKVLLDGKAIRDTPVLGATSLYASAHQNVSLQMSKRPRKHMDIDDQPADEMIVDADGLRMTVWTSKAKKLTDAEEQSMYLHLNFKMEHGVPQGAKGLLAELIGDAPMSEATRAMFKQGRRGGQPLQPPE